MIDNELPREVFILGAGFSKAISSFMPVTDELGPAIERRLPRERLPPRLTGGGSDTGEFEAWLSGLAEDQPWLDEAENLSRRALFSRVSQAIYEELAEREVKVLGGEGPSWLWTLLSVWHARSPTVITFNQDELVECAVDGHYLRLPDNQMISSHDVLGGLPARPRSLARHQEGAFATFQLLKLHGSLSWRWAPADATGSTLARWKPQGTFGAPEPTDQDRLSLELPGREPFIVPPSATKSRYYSNMVTRELWKRAATALRAADRVVLMGYSLPTADLTVSRMMSEAFEGRDLHFEVVNPDCRVVGRLVDLGVDPSRISSHSASNCVEQFATQYVDAQAGKVVQDLSRTEIPESPGQLSVGWGRGENPGRDAFLRAVKLNKSSGDLQLEVAPYVPATSPEPWVSLLGAVPAARRLTVATTEGRILPIVSCDNPVTPRGNRTFMKLVPGGRPAALLPEGGRS